MGIYDREYYRHDEQTGLFSGRSMVVNLILANAAMFVLILLTDGRVDRWLALGGNFFEQPWEVWRLVSYGFLHSRNDIMHIVLNMFGLYIFGREVEDRLGSIEFLRFYLVAIVVAGLVWLVADQVAGRPGYLIGASGAVTGVILLFVFAAPQRRIYLFGIFPMPAWAFAGLFILGDVFGAANRTSSVAHSAHLAGAGFATAYYYLRWNLGALVSGRLLSKLRSPKLRVLHPEEDPRDLNLQVDEILDKISRKGESSLTAAERRTLEAASKRYQRRQQ
ncbi:MAG: rhomboid family intramembrane serine protease [Bryobacteraceae bacterium]|nr:rhomboid family intramembrane serine protease [Bryobacteraceae bacterium]